MVNEIGGLVKKIDTQNYFNQRIDEFIQKMQEQRNDRNYFIVKVKINQNDVGKNIRLLQQKEIYGRKFNFEIDDIIVMNNGNNIKISYNCINQSNCSYSFQYCYEFCTTFKKEGVYELVILFKKNLTNCYGLFSGCKNIVSIDCSHFDCSEVRNCSYMFRDCSLLKSIEFGNLDFCLVSDFCGMFYCCNELQKINLPKFNTKNAIYFNYMFYECKKLKNVDISIFDSSSCQSMEYMFYGCENINEIDMLKWDMKNLSEMSYLFYGCKNLKKLKMNCNCKNIGSSNMSQSFYGIPEKGDFIFKKNPECKLILSTTLQNWEWHMAD